MIPIEKIWRNVRQRIGFFTKETVTQLPESPGIYAWFLPLWIYHENLDELAQALRLLHLFDPTLGQDAAHKTKVGFNWDQLSIHVEKQARVRISDDLAARWRAMLENPEARQAFERALMEASILLPPLYVGKADSLATRYGQHSSGRTDFSVRFRRFVKDLPSFVSSLHVSDLLFVCIEVEPKIAKTVREKELHYLLEQVVMRIAGPTFSIK